MFEERPDLREFARAVEGIGRRRWGDARSAESADLGHLRSAACSDGWFDFGSEDELGAAVAAMHALGRLACPLPVMDGFVAGTLERLSGNRLAEAHEVLISPPPAAGEDSVPYLEAAELAKYVLTVDGPHGCIAVHPARATTVLPGIAVPSWRRVHLGAAEFVQQLPQSIVDQCIISWRLGIAARALGAAERTHELCVEHACIRSQFGRVIGSYGAVQQRIATTEIDLQAGKLLVERALELHSASSPDWPLAAEIATEYISEMAPRAQLAAHHTLGAVGYFTEHEAPWLFRRVHADVTRLQLLTSASGGVEDRLLETRSTLPSFDVGVEGSRLRSEFAEAFAIHGLSEKPITKESDDPDIVGEIARRGYLGMGWPVDLGGRNASLWEQLVLQEEIMYRRLPALGALYAVLMLGNAIIAHGSDDQKRRFLPQIRAGRLRFCLGYSEPEAGSDLASLRTRAVRDGDGWVIDGQKSWTTGADEADVVWLTTRTDPEAEPRHAGITMFIVPMDTPGISIQRHIGLSGRVSCTVFYDRVRVSDAARVGEVNGGWKIILDALAGERIAMGGIAAELHRQFDDLLAVVGTANGSCLGERGSSGRALLGHLAVRIQACRALVASAIGAAVSGENANVQAAMAAVMGGEVAEEFGEAVLKLLGPEAALSSENAGVPGSGSFEYGLRYSIMYVVGGGTNDIQRGIIARSLGLPR